MDALSELFVDWNDTLIASEDSISKIEREKEKTRRLGLE